MRIFQGENLATPESLEEHLHVAEVHQDQPWQNSATCLSNRSIAVFHVKDFD
jgi:hypothetical protein